MIALAIYVVRAAPSEARERQAKRLILAGAAIPAVVLAALLAYGLLLLPVSLQSATPDTLRVRVHGEQWWWRIRYEPLHSPAFALANEIRLPVGRPVEFLLESDNVSSASYESQPQTDPPPIFQWSDGQVLTPRSVTRSAS